MATVPPLETWPIGGGAETGDQKKEKDPYEAKRTEELQQLNRPPEEIVGTGLWFAARRDKHDAERGNATERVDNDQTTSNSCSFFDSIRDRFSRSK